MKATLINLIRAYRFMRKCGLLGGECCKFYPTCSEYAILAIEKHGLFKGFGLTLQRIAKCHPWQKNRVDLP